MRWDIRITIYALFAGAALAVSLMAAAIRLHFDGAFGALCLWGGLALFVILAMAALREGLLGERLLSSSGHGRRVTSLYGMLFSGIVFMIFMFIYLAALWRGAVATDTQAPHPAVSQNAVQTTPSVPTALDQRPLSETNPVLFAIIDDSEIGKEFTDKALDYFNNIRKQENPVQADAMLQPYYGLMIRFDGVLDNLNITATDEFYGVGINFKGGFINGGMLLICRYPLKYKNYIARLSANQPMSGIGTIGKLGSISLELNGCHPTSPQAAPLPAPTPPPQPEKK